MQASAIILKFILSLILRYHKYTTPKLFLLKLFSDINIITITPWKGKE